MAHTQFQEKVWLDNLLPEEVNAIFGAINNLEEAIGIVPGSTLAQISASQLAGNITGDKISSTSSLSISSLSVSGQATFNNLIALNGTLTVNNGTTNIITIGTIGSAKGFIISDGSHNNLVADNSGNVSMRGTVTSLSGSSLTGTVNIEGGTISGNVTVGGATGITLKPSTKEILVGSAGKITAGSNILTNSAFTFASGTIALGTKFSVAVDGTMTATGANVSGTATLTGGSVGSISIGSTGIHIGGLGSDTTGFSLNSNGSVYIKNGNFTGAVTITSGSLSNVSVAGTVTAGSCTISNSGITLSQGSINLGSSFVVASDGTATLSNVTFNNTLNVSTDISVASANGRGINFGGTAKIYKSSSTDSTWGGRLDSTSDQNMYFNITGGTNRGFVFKTTSPVAQIDASGNVISKGYMAPHGIRIDESKSITDTVLFSPQAYIEAGIWPLLGSIDSYATVNNTSIPYSKVCLSTSYNSMYSDYIPVNPGDTLYGEIWAMRESGSTGTAGTLYFGIERCDKDRKYIASNYGSTYFVASNVTVPQDSTWHKYSGTTTLPLSHTPYEGSDGGPVRYIRVKILVNYNDGTIPTYWGGIVLRKQNLVSDQGLTAVPGEFRSTHISLTDANTKLSKGSSDSLRVTTSQGYVDIGATSASDVSISTDRTLYRFNKDLYVNTHKVWTAGNDGNGSGLDADTVRGLVFDQEVRVTSTPTFAHQVLNGRALGAPTPGSLFTAGQNTAKTSITFTQASGSSAVGKIVHESSSYSADNARGVIHLIPSNTNSDASYVAVHGASGSETIRIYTNGNVESSGVIYDAGYNDYAELFNVEGKVEPGDVIMMNCRGGYCKASGECSILVVGVVSDTYGHVIGGDKDRTLEENLKKYVPIAICGRVYVKVVGPVSYGDQLVASEIDGIAKVCKNPPPGSVIGKALQEHSGDGIGKVEMLVLGR